MESWNQRWHGQRLPTYVPARDDEPGILLQVTASVVGGSGFQHDSGFLWAIQADCGLGKVCRGGRRTAAQKPGRGVLPWGLGVVIGGL